MRSRAAFTLIEILVSLMIFSIVGVAMLGIMFMATELYRRGETGRAANDESVAVLATLDDDLARMVPRAAGGWFYAAVSTPADTTIADADPDGGTLLAFKITRRDRSLVQSSGEGTHTIVAWWVDRARQLRRAERLVPPRTTIAHDDDLDALKSMVDMNTHGSWPVITTGCLHFGAYLTTDTNVRVADDDWYGPNALPMVGSFYCTGPEDLMPFPEAIRITTVLTGGGRFAPAGFLIAPISDGTATTPFRIAGIKALPTASGAMLRVDDEWIGYDGYNGKSISMTGSDPWIGRGRRRSQGVPHDAKAVVRLGYTHSLVRILR